MRRLFPLLLLLPSLAFGQGLPNGGISPNQIWSYLQWNSAWQSKVDNIAGVCANCTITNPTITAGTWQGGVFNNPTINGLTLSSLTNTTITGGTIDGAVIGGTSATNIGTLGTSGNVTIGNNTFGNTVFINNPNLVAGDGSQLKITPTGGSPTALATLLAPFASGTTGTGAVVRATGPTITLGNATGLPLSGIASIGANTFIGNTGGSAASPAAFTMPSCSGGANALNYTLNTGFTCNTITGGSATSITIASTTIGSGTSGRLLYDNAGVLGELATTGSGNVVLATSPTLTTPNLGTPSAATLTNATGLPVGGIASVAANTVLANATAGSASPTAASVPSCSTSASALQWTSGTGYGCNTSINAATLGGATFASPGAIGTTTASSGKFTTIQATSGITPNSASGIIGTTTNDNANSGSIGEFPSPSNLTNVSVTTNTPFNAASISLTAGDWDVQGCIYYLAASTTTWNIIFASINTTSAALAGYPGPGITSLSATFPTGPSSEEICSPVVRESVAITTTAYLVGQASFSTSTLTANGYIRARRVR